MCAARYTRKDKVEVLLGIELDSTLIQNDSTNAQTSHLLEKALVILAEISERLRANVDVNL